MSLFASLLLILLLVVVSAFLSCAEISIAASRKIRLEMMSKEGVQNADRVLSLQAQPGNFFTVVQIGLNAVAILGGVVGEPALTPHMREIVSTFYVGPLLENISFAMSFLVVTAFFILFADLMPKRLAMVAPERAAVALVSRCCCWRRCSSRWCGSSTACRSGFSRSSACPRCAPKSSPPTRSTPWSMPAPRPACCSRRNIT
jgi:CBS domain containing-hemolysin-like protein